VAKTDTLQRTATAVRADLMQIHAGACVSPCRVMQTTAHSFNTRRLLPVLVYEVEIT